MSTFPAKDAPALLKRHDDAIKDLHVAVNKIMAILETAGLTTSGPISAANLSSDGDVTADGNVTAANISGGTLQSTGNGGQRFTLTIGSDANGPYINIQGPY